MSCTKPATGASTVPDVTFRADHGPFHYFSPAPLNVDPLGATGHGQTMTETFDTTVRLTLFREFVRTGEPPTSKSIAEKLQAPADDVRSALERLGAAKAVVLQPESREILMASPLCTVPTPYRVRTQDRSYFGACIWDALGVIAMLQRDAAVDTSCACCGEAMTVDVRRGHPVPVPGIIHFAIPAKHWWENIVFT